MVSLDKTIRATNYKETQDQRAFLDKQSKLVVRFIHIIFKNHGFLK
jgi:hypothetical protein